MKKIILLITATLSLSFTANAQEAAPAEKKCDGPKCEKSAEACTAKIEEAFKKHDADKDGKLTLEEFKALAAECNSKCDKKSKCKKSSCKKSKCKKSSCDKGECDKETCDKKECKKSDCKKDTTKSEESKGEKE